jgi:hypothetical protein
VAAGRPSLTSAWLLPVLAAACLAGYVFVYATGRAGPPIRSDGFSYYVYLPAWFIYGDPSLGSVARDCCGGTFPDFTAIIRWPGTRRWVNAHPIGVAILQSPFFLTAHALTYWTNLSPDGFTLYYQHGAGLSGLAWTVAGLALLRRLLRRHFSDGVTAATLVVLLFGTNLYHYATYDSSYSHPYSFALCAALLLLTELWYESATMRRTILLGIVSGLMVLTRHTNVLLLAIIPLYGVTTFGLQAAVERLWERATALALLATIIIVVVAPQVVIYYRATGRLIVSSYGALGFTFASPHIAGVLFSVQKGLFFWSPLLLFAVAGLAMLRRRLRAFLLPIVLVLGADTYLIASWWDWQFGGSYGHRAFVDVLPMLALGLATFFEWSTKNRFRLATVTTITVLATGLSIFQMLQYWNHVLPISDTTWTQYRELFLQWR